jgi:hypothetical protein
MALIPLCTGDPLLDTLRETFAATPVRIPETRIQPLSALAATSDNASFRGQLEPLLAGRHGLEVPVAESPMAALAGKRSRSIRWSVGLKILDGFLQGLGLPGGSLAANMRGAERVSYSFANLLRRFVDLNQLGQALSGRRIRRTNPAAAIFFDQGSRGPLPAPAAAPHSGPHPGEPAHGLPDGQALRRVAGRGIPGLLRARSHEGLAQARCLRRGAVARRHAGGRRHADRTPGRRCRAATPGRLLPGEPQRPGGSARRPGRSGGSST